MRLPENALEKLKFPFHLDRSPGPAYLKVAAPPGFTAGFSLRPGGCSRGPWAEANMSFMVGDESRNVAANRAALLAKAGAGRQDFGRLLTVRQVHGTRCLVVDDQFVATLPDSETVAADALATSRSGVLLAVQTADCLPLIMISEKPRAVAVVHAGWRGLEKGIATETVELLAATFGVSSVNLKVYAGPAIGPCCFEVGPEVVEIFGKKSYLAGTDGWWREESGRTTLNLVAIQRAELLAAGVGPENFHGLELCTSCHDFCFSYRRDRAITGRQLAFAGIGREN